MDLTLFRKLSKFPFIYEGALHSSIELQQNKTCLEKCDKKDCRRLLNSTNNFEEFTCSFGYDSILLVVGNSKFILNGLIYTTNKTVPLGRKEVRQKWIVIREDVLIFGNKIIEIENYLAEREKETTVKNLSIFHDFKTSMNIIYSCTEEIISNLPGNTFEVKLQGSGSLYQALYHSLSLLTSQLRMIDIFINPQSILFGNKRLINIYQLFDKIKRLFEKLAEKRKRDVRIVLNPERFIDYSYCYESIEFIPLILIDNALKYCVSDSDIEIKMEQGSRSVNVIIKNIGPLVSDENKDRIFEKFFRDEYAKNFSREGMGMGLWIAQQILNAHQSKLSYYNDNKGQSDHRKIGLNIFSFELSTVRVEN